MSTWGKSTFLAISTKIIHIHKVVIDSPGVCASKLPVLRNSILPSTQVSGRYSLHGNTCMHREIKSKEPKMMYAHTVIQGTMATALHRRQYVMPPELFNRLYIMWLHQKSRYTNNGPFHYTNNCPFHVYCIIFI